MTLSSRGLGHRPFTAVTAVRIRLGSPKCKSHPLRWLFCFIETDAIWPGVTGSSFVKCQRIKKKRVRLKIFLDLTVILLYKQLYTDVKPDVT